MNAYSSNIFITHNNPSYSSLLMIIAGVIIGIIVLSNLLDLILRQLKLEHLSYYLGIGIVLFSLSMVAPKLTYDTYTMKYSYNLSLGGFVEFDVALNDKQHKLDRVDKIDIYKKMRESISTVNFTNSRESIEENLKSTLGKTLMENYGLSENDIKVLITII